MVVRLDRLVAVFFFFSSRRRHTRCSRDWSSDVCSSDLGRRHRARGARGRGRLAGGERRRREAGEGVRHLARRRDARDPKAAGSGGLGLLRGFGFLLTRLTARDASEGTDQADERAAVGTGIALGGTLLIAARAAHHRVVLHQFRFVGHGPPQMSSPYTLILLISVAREIPSSRAARVRLPP